MTDVGFVIAGYTVIIGGVAAYAGTLLLRLRAARREEHAMRDATRDHRPDPPAAPPGRG